MTTQPRIDELKRRHATLEQAIDGESHRPSPDEAELTEMKKQKLALKDEITALQEHA